MNTAKNPSMHDRHTRRLARVSLLLSLLLATPGFTGQPTGRGVTPEPGSQTPTASFRMAAPAETTTPAPRELPSDAEMIAHFQAHRKEFEELVRLYQTDERRNKVGNRQPFWTQPYNELLARVGLSHITDDGALWLPDPYSVETTKKARAMDVFQAFAHHGLIFVVENRTFSVRVRRLVVEGLLLCPGGAEGRGRSIVVAPLAPWRRPASECPRLRIGGSLPSRLAP